tara:strand:+ start:173 stop:484 length:312 start_codon:yes stop_codon:yes gene_type:complete
MKFFRVFLLIYLYVFISSCGSVKDAFTNQKKNSSDEFLVEKKSPLVMPPSYNELPVPNSEVQKSSSSSDIKNLIKKGKNQNKENSEDINQNFEDTLLKKIKRN